MDILGTQNWLGTPSLQSPKSWQQNTTFMGGFNSLHTCIVFTKRFVNFFPWHSWKLRWTLFTTIPGCQDIKKEAGQGHHPFKTKEREWFGKAAVESNSNKSSYTSPPSWCVSLNGHEYHGGGSQHVPSKKKEKGHIWINGDSILKIQPQVDIMHHKFLDDTWHIVDLFFWRDVKKKNSRYKSQSILRNLPGHRWENLRNVLEINEKKTANQSVWCEDVFHRFHHQGVTLTTQVRCTSLNMDSDMHKLHLHEV